MALNFIVSRINPDCITIRCTYTYKDKDGAWRCVHVAPDILHGTDNECFAISVADETIRGILQRTSQPYPTDGSASDAANSKTASHDFPDIDGLDIISRNEAADALCKKASVIGYSRLESALRIIKEISSMTGAPCGSPEYDLISRKFVLSELRKDGCDYNFTMRDVLDKLPPAKNVRPSRLDKKGKKCDGNVLPVVFGCVTVTGDSPNALIDAIQTLTAPGNGVPKDGDDRTQQKCKNGNKEDVSPQDAPANGAAFRQKIFDYINSRLREHSAKMQEGSDCEFHRASKCEAYAIRKFVENLLTDGTEPDGAANIQTHKNETDGNMRELTADEVKRCRSYLERGVYDPYCEESRLLQDMVGPSPRVYTNRSREWAKMQRLYCHKFLSDGVYDKNDVNYRAIMAMLGGYTADGEKWHDLRKRNPVMPEEHKCNTATDDIPSFMGQKGPANRSDDVLVTAFAENWEPVLFVARTYNGNWNYYPCSPDTSLWYRPIAWTPLPKYSNDGNG